MTSPSPRPWYKQFWPWFLISIPLLSIILSSTMLNLAINTDDSLVIDDYYKEGKGINRQLVKYQEAKARNISTKLSINQQGDISLTFVTGAPDSWQALQLSFHHATLASKDFKLMLVADANGIYRGTVNEPLQGKWKVTLSPIDEVWKITQTIALPRESAISFKP